MYSFTMPFLYGIFPSLALYNVISTNLMTDISDHHAQFLITPKIQENEPNKMTFR